MLVATVLAVTVCILATSLEVLSTPHLRQVSTPEDDSYVAAVLEYNFSRNTSVNLAAYLEFIQEAAAQNADIVVFPELCLNQMSPIMVADPSQNLLTPALSPDDFHWILVTLSQAAIDNQIYVVVNIEELLDCLSGIADEDCPENKEYLFNTNVVFDRSGTIIDRYRKITLFGEFTRTPAFTPDLGIFTTDFGVTFGHFICFDLMFQVPAIQLVQKHNVRDVIFSTMWFSEAPYLTAVQIQEAYAYAMDINFLASGANNVGIGSAGSGIYSGKAGALTSIMPGVPTSRLLVSRVPKVPGLRNGTYPGPIVDPPLEADSLFLIRDPSLSAHVTRSVHPGLQEFSLTHNEVTCQFRIQMSMRGEGVQYQYRAGVFDGIRSFSGLASGGARLCSVFSCTGDDILTCGERFQTYTENSTAIFEELSIVATVPTPVINQTLAAANSFYVPLSLDVSTLPLKTDEYSYSEAPGQNGMTVLTLVLENPHVEIYSMAIWGRMFETDGQEPTPANAAMASVLNSLLVGPALLLVVRNYLS